MGEGDILYYRHLLKLGMLQILFQDPPGNTNSSPSSLCARLENALDPFSSSSFGNEVHKKLNRTHGPLVKVPFPNLSCSCM